jgi:3'(2'), 5'-bisphosphate nucleotidase
MWSKWMDKGLPHFPSRIVQINNPKNNVRQMQFPFGNPLPETELAFRAINEATRKVLEIYNGVFEARQKEDKSPVTLADIESHRIIARILSDSGITIVSEEGETNLATSGTKFWLVDPLDGTREFVDKNGEFTIMIALVNGGRPVLGLISHPLAGSVYLAQGGQGAFKFSNQNWSRLRVNETSALAGSRAVISRSHVSPEELGFIESLKISSHTRLGSSLKALKICSGEAELYFAANSKMKQWDTCASYCLVAESGGKMTDMFGGEITYSARGANHERGVVITNGRIHNEFIAKCDPMRKRLESS